MKKLVTFVETKVFSKRISGMISDDAFAEFQLELAQDPDKGPVIEGTGGLRKVRCKLEGRGKSGSLRIIYLYIKVKSDIHLVFVFAKKESATLSAEQKRQLKSVVDAIKKEYAK
jgi:hypothetical protein